MNSGYYAACAGLRAQTQALELIANNVSNINTTGYRGQLPMFSSVLAASGVAASDPLNRAINDFNVLEDSRTDMNSGNLSSTGNPLDLAIEGPGFFAVKTATGTLYTRNGSFQVSPNGQLVTNDGGLVLSDQGPVSLPSGEISISADGTISVNGAVAGQIRMVEFAPGSAPVPMGTSYYAVPDAAVRPASNSYLREGMLESSNVNPVAATVQLIAVQRRAEMLERAMSAFYSNFNHIAANDLPHV